MAALESEELMSDETPRRGKIARLPLVLRDALCQRMLDGEQAPTLLPWLNALPEMAEVLKAQFDGQPVTDSNLSDWRKGGFVDWQRKRERIEKTKQLADFALKMGEAGAGNFGMSSALAGGAIMEVLEDFDPSMLRIMLAEKPETFMELVSKVAALQSSAAAARNAETAARGADAKEKAIAQKDTELAQRERALQIKEQEFERQTCSLFLKWAKDAEALAIATGKAPQAVKMDQLLLRMFGEKPKTTPGGGV
jgi:uncharacterized protein (DUF2249 family)